MALRKLQMGAATAAAAAAWAMLSVPAVATQINTGGETGAYHASFCPPLAKQLEQAQFGYRCEASSGTRENLDRVATNPRQLSYGQLDVYAFEARQLKAEGMLALVSHDDVRACLFAITRNKDISNWGELSAYASKLRFILPPAAHDAAGTFRFLRAIDPDGLGRANSITHALTPGDAVRQALSGEDTVSLIVELPDPDAPSFALARSLGGHLVPVIDRAILRQELDGKKLYFAQEVEIEHAGWARSARKMVTACTPQVVFTGAAERVQGDQARRDHQDLIRTVSALKRADLLPQESVLQRALKRTREVSAVSTERALELTEQARAKARPYADKALEKAREVGDQAKPYVDKTKEAAQKAYDEALRLGKELMDKARPESPPKKD